MQTRTKPRLRPLLALLLLAALLAGCAKPVEVKSRAATYTNPVYIGTDDGLWEAPDPGVIKFNGEYYAYTTGDPCQVVKSLDLINWEYVGPMIAEPDNCWAPDVTYKDGTFYAYLSTRKKGYAEGGRRVKLYTATDPAGPFTFQEVVTDNYSYDAAYFRDEAGQEYLYWTEECATLGAQPCYGNATVVDRLIDMKFLAGETTLVTGPTPDGWECKGRCIVEAPSLIARDGRYYMLYSGGAYENPTYGQGLAASAVPMGPGGKQDQSWSQLPQVLASIEYKVDGPGGASWVKAPNNLDDWLIYHARGINRTDWDRWLRVDPVMWGQDRLWVPGGPSHTERRGPGLPQFQDVFSRADAAELGQGWSVTGGRWGVTGGAALQAETAGAARALLDAKASDYLFEANLRWAAPNAGSATGKAGVVIYWADEMNNATAYLEPATGLLTVDAVAEGKPLAVKPMALPTGFRAHVYHQVLVAKNGPLFTFTLDGLSLGSAEIPLANPGRTGLATVDAAVAFDGISLTEGWDDLFSAPAQGWSEPTGKAAAGDRAVQGGDWAVHDGVLAQSRAQGEAALLKGSGDWKSYTYTVSLRRTGGDGDLGLYAAYQDAKNHVRVMLDPSGGNLWFLPTLRGKAGNSASVPLAPLFPEPLDFGRFHTLRVEKEGFTFTIYLDGVQVTTQTLELAQGRVGLVTSEAAAEFDSIRAVRRD